MKKSTCHITIFCLFQLLTLFSITGVVSASDKTAEIQLTAEEQAWLQQHPVIEIGIMQAWPPMDYVDESGRPQGVGVEIIYQLNKQLGDRLKITPGPWKETYNAVKEQRLPALMDISPKESRKPFFNFTQPYVTVPHNIFTRKEHPKHQSLDDLSGDTVAIEKGFFLVKVLRKGYPSVIVKEFDNTSDALDALAKGDVDAYVGNRAVATHIINSELISGLIIQGKVHESVSINAIGVRKDWPILRSILDKALAMIPEAEHQRIRQQWVEGIGSGFDNKALSKILLPILLVIIVLIFWNRNLKWAVKRRTKELVKLSSLQGAILQHAGYAIIVTDLRGAITLFNPAAEKMLGYRSEEVVGKLTPVSFHHPDELAEKAVEFSLELNMELKAGLDTLAAHAKQGCPCEHEYTFLRKDGTELPSLFTVSQVLDEQGEVAGYLGVAVDISERKAAELALQQAKEDAVAASMAKDEFLASMSHELRTPLTAIIGYSDLLISQEYDAHKLRLLRSIELSGHSQLALVNDILDMSKIQSGRFTVEAHPYDFSGLIGEMEQMFTPRTKDEGIQLEVIQSNIEPMQLVGDSQRIKQVLINLLDNALKFTEKGSNSIIKLSTQVDLSGLVITVEDHGIGMNAETLKQVFERFHQADGSISRRFGGSGLGLYISQNLVDLMGGRFEVSSQPGIGSSFRVILPYLVSGLSAKQKGVAAESEHQLEKKRLSGHVLLAEDTVILQQLERQILELMGVTVSIANNGIEAYQLAASNHYDLILMDMQMPEMDGIEATRKIRESGNKVPIVALTANVMQKHRELFEEAGGNDFLGKPIDNQALKQAISHYLQEQGTDVGQSHSSSVMGPEELAALFAERTAVRKNNMVEALSHQNWEEVREQAHVFKGSGSPYGYPEISRLGAVICDAIDVEHYEDVAQQVEALTAELDALHG
ncbi:MAG: transporter substrate-binding domain-containing protein [Gammaproteobacteria bacterium]|nr:transporter substrate-binding domain-containing protein [Gammaproteobacteria bacterium]